MMAISVGEKKLKRERDGVGGGVMTSSGGSGGFALGSTDATDSEWEQ